jgi:hypothetical protein
MFTNGVHLNPKRQDSIKPGYSDNARKVLVFGNFTSQLVFVDIDFFNTHRPEALIQTG